MELYFFLSKKMLVYTQYNITVAGYEMLDLLLDKKMFISKIPWHKQNLCFAMKPDVYITFCGYHLTVFCYPLTFGGYLLGYPPNFVSASWFNVVLKSGNLKNNIQLSKIKLTILQLEI